jgi:hypothetical protein
VLLKKYFNDNYVSIEPLLNSLVNLEEGIQIEPIHMRKLKNNRRCRSSNKVRNLVNGFNCNENWRVIDLKLKHLGEIPREKLCKITVYEKAKEE